MPRVSGTEQGFFEKTTESVSAALPPSVVDFFSSVSEFVLNNITVSLLSFLGVIFVSKFVYKSYKKKQHIQKLWQFILFFLAKRQMILPLVHTLAKRDKILNKKSLDEMLILREDCKKVSFRVYPSKRLILERKVSTMLLTYFSELEKEGKIVSNSKFERITQDLEFIDVKLSALQSAYNNEVGKWNLYFEFPRVLIFWPFKFLKVEKFGD
ncbi:MAG: hypothetical protein OEL89_04705 [Candidatus Peregrinibacteria bacterium]|nr:hypothetical protein [Candidatus Peregrinibacteria bacterium]